LQALAASQQGDLEEIAVTMGKSCQVAELSQSEDVTQSFLQTMKFVGPESLRSSAYAYKGLIHELMGRANDQNISKVGIMAGKDDAVIEVCVGDDVSTILSSDEMNNHWKKLGYEIMGLVAWSHGSTISSKYEEDMAKLVSIKDKPYLLMVCYATGDPDTWEFNLGGSGMFTMVDMMNKSKKRRKDVVYKVFPIEKVGVTVQDEAKALIAKAVGNHVMENMKQAYSSCKARYLKHKTPPDGYCFWHCILAGLDETYFQVKRHASGFAMSNRREQAEAQAAKNLMYSGAGDGNAETMFENGYVQLQQISEIRRQLNLAIRVTVDDEAGRATMYKHVLYIYISTYIYIYVVCEQLYIYICVLSVNGGLNIVVYIYTIMYMPEVCR